MGYYWNFIAVWPITQHFTENIDFEMGAQMQILKKKLLFCVPVQKLYHKLITAHFQHIIVKFDSNFMLY